MALQYEEAALVDRVQLTLTDQDEQDINFWINDRKEAVDQDRTDFLARYTKYLYNFDDFVTYNRKGPWESSSNLHMPLTSIMVKTFHSRLYNIFSHPNTTQYLPREGSDVDLAMMLKRLRDWYLWDYINGYRGIKGFTSEVFYDCVTSGFGIGIKDWMIKQRKTIDLVENEEFKKEMRDLEPQLRERAETEQTLETSEEIEKRSINIKPYKEVEKLVKVFSGTRLRTIPFENVYFPNEIPESNDLDYPLCVIVETMENISDIKLRAEQGEWSMDRAKIVDEEGAQNYQGTRAQNIKEQKGKLSGYEQTQRTYFNKETRIIQYAFCTYDIDKDGIDEELFVVRSQKGTILKVQYLDRISPSGMRPIYKFDCFAKPRQAYARGIPEFMWPLQEEMDQHHNMRIDYLTLQTCPFGMYKASSSLKNEEIRISPGKFIPVDETTDMAVLNFNTNARTWRDEEDRLWNYAERLASASSLSQGIVPQQVGPTRSTSGVLALLRQMDKEFMPVVEACARSWKKLEKMLMDDLDKRVDVMEKMKILGGSQKEQDYLKKKYPEFNSALRIGGMFDVRIDVASVIQSDELRRNEAQVMLEQFNTPGIAHQMGIIGPKGMYKSWVDHLIAHDQDPDKWLDKPAMAQEPLTIYAEIQICGQGEMPPMSMRDDHGRKAQELLQFMNEPEYQEAKSSGLFVEGVDQYVMKAAQKHLTLAEMLQQPKATPRLSGGGGGQINQRLAGTAPQQGGQDPNKTTSRDINYKGVGNQNVPRETQEIE